MRDSSCIGLIIPEIQNPFYSAVVDIITRIAEENGYMLLLGISNNKSIQEEEYVKLFLSRRVLGIIIVPMLRDNANISHLDMVRSANIPLVFCTENYGDCEEPTVLCDFEAGQYEMTKYLIKKGLRDFCFVSTKLQVKFALLRFKGFERALSEAGIPLDESKIFLLDQPRYGDAYVITDEILKCRPEAIVCINDIMTIGIMKRLAERNVDVPNDISLAGFDDMMFSQLVQKPLTTVKQPLEEICGMAMQILEKKIRVKSEQSEIERGKVYYIKPELVIRGTTV
jgi:LacI family transcriptional regulator